MTTDEKVELAKRIAESLKKEWELNVTRRAAQRKKDPKPRDFEFPRNEWEKFIGYVSRKGMQNGVQLVEYMAKSPSLRTDPQNVAACMSRVIRGHLPRLVKLSSDELVEILGYVSRWIVWLNFTGVMEHEKSLARYTGRKPRGRHRSH